MIVKHETSHTAAPVAYRIQWANGEVDFLAYIPKGESGVYACEPVYTNPPEPARDARDAKRYRWLRERMDVQDVELISLVEEDGDFGTSESVDTAIDAAMAQESGE